MKKIYVKYKILVNGLHTTTPYTIDGFTLKSSMFDKDMFNNKYDENKEGIDFNLNFYLESCFTDFEKLSYNYFESDNYEEIEVSNKVTINSKTVTRLLQSKIEIYNRINDLERKIRLILNIPLMFQIVCFEFYDEDMKFLTAVQGNRQLSFWNRLTYKIDPEEFANNSRYGMDFNAMKSTDNNQFNRALEFYNDSFDSEKISSRYILIFSTLESIFNLDRENITKKISRYSAKLLAEGNDKEYNQVYSDIKKLYKKRCDYIHGSKTNNILDEDEKLLRSYVRKIILAYWMIILYTKKTAKQILDYLNSDEKLDLQLRLFISALNSNNFTEQQHRIVDIVEKEIGQKIPEETKQIIYSKCNDEK